MKLKYLIIPAMMTAMALGNTACNSDNEGVGESKPTIMDETQGQWVKLRLHLNGNSATRGNDGGFVNGTDQESRIKRLTLTFYDTDGKYLSANTLTEDEIGAGLIVVSTKSDVQPARLLAWANIEGAATTLSGLNFAEALAKTCTSGVKGMDGLMVMTSSSYMKEGQIVYGSAITAENTALSQNDVLEASAVDVYLDRMAAKVTINKGDQISVQLPAYNSEGVTFELKGMALNGTNRSSYYIKNIADYGFSLNQWTTAWNVADLCRSYWATDPNYMEEGSNLSAYDYRTYKEIAQNHDLTEYCTENTSGMQEFNIQNATHVLIVGQYTLQGVRKGANLYLYNGKLMTAQSYKSLVHNKHPYYVLGVGGNHTALDNSCYRITRNGMMGTNAANVKITLGLEADETVYKVAEGAYVSLTVAQANAELAQEPDGIKYGQGKCYYAAPIEHFGREGEVGQYGVVRNHLYQITVTSIKSFGSGIWDPGDDPDDDDPSNPDNPGTDPDNPDNPGTDPDNPDNPGTDPDDPDNPGIDPGDDPDDDTDDPDDPDEPGEPIVPEPQEPEESYMVGLRIKVLDWHVVEQDVDL